MSDTSNSNGRTVSEVAYPAPVAVIGAGAVGSALARGLKAADYPVAAIISRTAGPARRLAAEVGAPVASAALGDLPASASFLFCCVPDDQIRPVAEELARLPRNWRTHLVAHTSGARTTDALAPLATVGATVLSFHPVQAFTEDIPPEVFDGIYVGLEGEEEALVTGRRLAEVLGARAVSLSKEAKTRYHLAASMASNFTVTLMALAGDVLVEAGLDRDEAIALLQPLVEGTLRNLGGAAPEEALTGPVARGDEGTVVSHLEALREHHSDLLPTYASLATETVRLAARAGRLSSETTDRLLEKLGASLDPISR